MLPFMKDQDSPQEPTGAENTTGGIGSLDGEERFLTTAQHGRHLRHSTIMLAVVFTAGALCVWFMIKKVTPAPTVAAEVQEEAKIENAIAQLTGIKTEMDNRMGDIVAKFSELADVEQIDVTDLKKNPFEHELSVGGLTDGFDSARELLRREVEEKAQGLQLWGIMASDGEACCMINNKFLHKGDKIAGFTVAEIDKRFVKVELDGIGVILRMPE